MKRKTVGAEHPNGDFIWFDVVDARKWKKDGELNFVAPNLWVERDLLADLTNEPAKVVTPKDAVRWLTLRGFEVPTNLASPSRSE